MSISPSPRQPMGSLSVGNVVSASLRLYLDHLKAYFGVALRATLWSLLPFLVILPIPFLLISGQVDALALSLLILIWLPLLVYCSAKYITNSALISRLAFCQLVNRPESVQEARRQINPNFWRFLLTYFLYFLIIWGVLIGFYIVIILMVFIGALLVSSLRENIAAIVIISLIGIIAFAIALSAMIRLFIRIFMVEVPLAIEENITAYQTIGRSWNLTKGKVGRIFLILTVAFLLTLPLYVIVQFGASIIQTIILGAIQKNPTSTTFQIGLQFFSFIVVSILGLVSGVVVLPFWQTIKAVIYYDLCSRLEGLGLQVRDSHL